MKESFRTTFAISLLVTLLSGCAPAGLTTVPPTVSAPHVVTQVIAPQTAAPATAAAPKGAVVSANGVEFVIPVELGNSASATIIPEVVSSPDSPDWGVAPVYYKFTLQGGTPSQEATIAVYPAKEYAQVHGGAARSVEKLKAVLAAPPSTRFTKEAMPTLAVPAALGIASNIKVVAFPNGNGVRMVGFYAQAPLPVTSSLNYYYHGLTADGKYYLTASLPITAPSLKINPLPFPDMNSRDNTAVGLALTNYYDQITERLNTAEKENTFTPSITLLDTFMQSIKINSPTIVQPAPTVAQPTTGPTSNSTATSCGDGAFFQKDLTIPDGTVVKPNEKFTKKWELKNTGTCNWTPNYTLVFQKGDPMSSPTEIPLTSGNVTVAPGAMFAASIDFKAPATPGTYRSYWSIKNAAGKLLPIEFYVEIKVSP